jgi:hypothetical protein
MLSTVHPAIAISMKALPLNRDFTLESLELFVHYRAVQKM